MSIRLQCGNCKKRYLVSDQISASQVDCRDCGHTISVKPRAKTSGKKHRSQSKLACPACTKIALTERTLKNGVKVDSCKSCRGTWLDAGEFLQLTRHKEDATQNVLALSWGAVKSKRHCPHCQTSMSEAAFLDDETRIDFCQQCDGLWFDDGELKDSLQGLSTSADRQVAYQPYVPRSRKRKKRKEEDSLVPEKQGFFTVFYKGRNVAVALVGAWLIWIGIQTPQIVILILMGASVAYSVAYSRSRCKECKQKWAYEYTGNGERRLLRADTAEMKCRFCGDTKWVTMSSGGGGGN